MNLLKIVFCFLWKKIQEVKLLDPMQGLFLILLRSSKIFSIVAAPIYIPSNSAKNSLFSISSPTLGFVNFLMTAILTGVDDI